MQVITGLAQAVLHCMGLWSIMSHTQCSFLANVLPSTQFSVSAGGPKAKNAVFILGCLRHYTNSWSSSDRSKIG